MRQANFIESWGLLKTAFLLWRCYIFNPGVNARSLVRNYFWIALRGYNYFDED